MQLQCCRSRAFPQTSSHRVRDRVDRRQSCCLDSCDTDNVPAHRSERVRPPRIADTRLFAAVPVAALIFHVDSRLRPAKIQAKRAFTRHLPSLPARFDLVIHDGYPQVVSAISAWKPQKKRQPSLARRRRAARHVLEHPCDLGGAIQMRIARAERSERSERSERLQFVCSLGKRNRAGERRPIRSACLPEQLQKSDGIMNTRCHLAERKIRRCQSHWIIQAAEGAPGNRGFAKVGNRAVARPTARSRAD